MHQIGPDLREFGTMRGAPLSDCETLFRLHLCLEEDVAKIPQSAKGTALYKSSPRNNMVT